MLKVVQLQKLYLRFRTSTKRLYKKSFKGNLLLTNTVTSVAIFGAGDIIMQTMEQSSSKKIEYDFKRTGRMLVFASVLGAPQHFWYMALDRFIVKGVRSRVVMKKVLADQLILAPSFYVLFFGILGTLEGKSTKVIKDEFKEKFPTLYIADCSVFSVTQTINFRYVPNHLRIVYVNGVNLLWTLFISNFKHRDQHKSTEQQQKQQEQQQQQEEHKQQQNSCSYTLVVPATTDL